MEILILLGLIIFAPELFELLTPTPKKKKEEDIDIQENAEVSETWCQHVIYKPLSIAENTGDATLPKGYCYKGDQSFWDDKPHEQGHSYAQDQVKQFEKKATFESKIGEELKSIVLILQNTTTSEIDTNIADSNNETVVFPPQIGIPIADSASGVTYDQFTANWGSGINAQGYYIDVATDSNFASMVSGYNNLDVSNVLTYAITGLTEGTTYYYRVRAYNQFVTSQSSNVISATTISYLRDKDDNIYNEITIGSQTWIIQNFRSTKYADGSSIPNIQGNKYDDWFLPSKDELNQMYVNLHLFGVGNFALNTYWSSSEFNDIGAKYQSFFDGSQGNNQKDNTGYIRSIRSFTASIGAYALRDIGPAGGYIFYINGTTYYEAAPTDQSTGVAWSDVVDVAIGTTSTSIGEGQNNTNEMLAQSATAPSAKLCGDLSIGGWINNTTGAYCAYDNDTDNIADYGLLYNWYAVDNAAGLAYLQRAGVQETGWRVATDADYTALTTYIGGLATAGTKLKEAGTTHWHTAGGTDIYGFRARGSGFRRYDTGGFLNLAYNGDLWSATASNVTTGWNRVIAHNTGAIIRNDYPKTGGFAVRLVKDI